jgi:hypothetical protein
VPTLVDNAEYLLEVWLLLCHEPLTAVLIAVFLSFISTVSFTAVFMDSVATDSLHYPTILVYLVNLATGFGKFSAAHNT